MTSRPPAMPLLSAHDFDAFGAPFVLLDADWRIVFGNRAAAQLRQLSASELIGLSFQEAFDLRAGSDLDLVTRRVMHSRLPETFETYYPVADVWAQGMVFPFQQGLGVLYQDVSARKRAEARQEALYRVTTELSRAVSSDDVVQAIMREAVPATRAARGVIGVLEPGGETLRLLGAQHGPQAQPPRFAVTLDAPEAHVSRTGEAVFGRASELEARFSAFRELHPDRLSSLAVLPLAVSGVTLGFLALVFEGEHAFDEGEQQFLLSLAGQCAQALDRARQHLRAHQELQARQASEAALAAERARLAAVLEHLPVGVVIGEVPSARILMGNARVEEIFGHPVYHSQTLDEYRAWTGRHLDGRPVEPHEWPLARLALHGETTVGERLAYLRPDGEQRVIDVTSAPVRDPQGRPFAGVVVIEDVTERQQAEQAVRDLNANLEALVQARTAELAERTRSLEAFVDFAEAAGTAHDARRLSQQALGVFRSFFSECSAAYYELDGALWRAQVWTEDLAPEVVASIAGGVPVSAPAFWQAAQSRQPVFVDGWDPAHEQVAATEAYGTVALYPLLVQGEVQAILAVGLKDAQQWSARDRAVVRAAGRSLNLALERADVSARLEAQRAALANRTRALEAFGELSRDLSENADPLQLIQRAQQIVLSLLPSGYAPYYERDGALWRLRSQVGDRRNPGMQRVVDAGLPYASQSLRVPYESGEPYYQDAYDYQEDHFQIDWAQVGAVASLPVRVGGAVQGVFCVALFGRRGWSDADRALLETVARSLGLALEAAHSTRALQQRTQELERSNRELERFAYVASHDLQEPLRTVTSFVDLLALRSGEQLDERAHRYLDFVRQGTLRMRSLIHDLLGYSRLTSHEAASGVADADLACQEARASLAAASEAAGAVIEVGPLPLVRADQGRLAQVFQNLLGNALKFRREGVTPTVQVRAEREAEGWHFTVTDNGIGIEAVYLERIFEVFQRLHLRGSYEGNGIGLSICKKIVEQAGGRLWAESMPGAGSTFHFTLPAAEPGA